MRYILALSLIINLILFSAFHKYIPIELATWKIKQNEYRDGYKCLEFSNDLVSELNDRGVQASVLIGESPTTAQQDNVQHAWVGIWIESQTGLLTKDYKL